MARGLRFAVWAGAATLLAIGAWAAYRGQQPATEASTTFTLAAVERGQLTLEVSATGTLSPLTTVLVGSQVSGSIQQVYADYNSKVRQGQVIAQIEPSLFEAQVAQAKAKFESAVAESEKAWVTVQDAQRQLDRARRLHARNMLSESEVDSAQFAYDAALVEHKAKVAAEGEARAALGQAQVNLRHTTIHAPIDGVVLSRDVDVGQTVAASLQAPTLFTIAQDLRHMQIETDVDEAFIGMVHEDLPVTFSVFAYPNETFRGTLAQVRLSPRVESEVVLYNCIIHVDNPDLRLKPGMTATVTIKVQHREGVLKVPNAALRYIPDLPPEELKALRAQSNLSDGEALLWTPEATGVKPVKVALGLTSDRETEVSAEGLAEGMPVIVADNRKAATKKRTTGIRLF